MFGASASVAQTNSSSSGQSSENSSVRKLNTADEEFVRNLVRGFSGGTTADLAGARKQAISDVQGSIQNIFAEFSQTALPQIMTQQNRTGGYNSSTAQLLTNDAFARTVAKGSELTLSAINQYENAALAKSGQALQGLGTSLETLLQAAQESKTDTKSSSKSKSTTVNASASYGI